MDGTENEIMFKPFLDSKCKPMSLKDQTFIGLTFGQILLSIGLLGGLITAYTDVNVKIASVTVRTEKLEQSRAEERQLIEVNRVENANAFSKMNDKLDLLLIRNGNEDYVK